MIKPQLVTGIIFIFLFISSFVNQCYSQIDGINTNNKSLCKQAAQGGDTPFGPWICLCAAHKYNDCPDGYPCARKGQWPTGEATKVCRQISVDGHADGGYCGCEPYEEDGGG